MRCEKQLYSDRARSISNETGAVASTRTSDLPFHSSSLTARNSFSTDSGAKCASSSSRITGPQKSMLLRRHSTVFHCVHDSKDCSGKAAPPACRTALCISRFSSVAEESRAAPETSTVRPSFCNSCRRYFNSAVRPVPCTEVTSAIPRLERTQRSRRGKISPIDSDRINSRAGSKL